MAKDLSEEEQDTVKKAREEIDNLPRRKGPAIDKGGSVSEQVIDLPDATEITAEPPLDVPPTEGLGENEMLPEEPLSLAQPEAPSAPMAAPAPAPMAAPEAMPQQAAMPQQQIPYSAQINQEIGNFAQDLGERRINPKTYKDFYANKDTPGKLGSLLALAVGGFGAGLARQQPFILEMMKKEIDKDYDAQKQNEANRLSWYNAGIEHEYKKSLASKNFSSSMADIAQATKTNVDTYGNALGYGLNAVYSIEALQNVIDTMPQGSAQQQMATQFLNQQFVPYMMKYVNQNSVEAENKSNLINSMQKMKPSAPMKIDQDGPVDYDKYNKIKQMTHQASVMQKPGPGGLTTAQLPQLDAEIAKVQHIRAIYEQYDKNYKELVSKFGAGDLTPEQKRSYINTIIGPIANMVDANTEQARAQLSNSIFPNKGDVNSYEKHENGIKIFENAMKSAAPLASNPKLGIVRSLPKVEGLRSAKQQKQPKIGDTRKIDGFTEYYIDGPKGKNWYRKKSGK